LIGRVMGRCSKTLAAEAVDIVVAEQWRVGDRNMTGCGEEKGNFERDWSILDLVQETRLGLDKVEVEVAGGMA